MCHYRTKEIKTILILFLILWFPTNILTSPIYGGDKPNVSKELPSREREVKLNHGIAECVRTAWIGDTNRTLICVEYRYKKEVK